MPLSAAASARQRSSSVSGVREGSFGLRVARVTAWRARADVYLPRESETIEATVPRHATLDSLLRAHRLQEQLVIQAVNAARGGQETLAARSVANGVTVVDLAAANVFPFLLGGAAGLGQLPFGLPWVTLAALALIRDNMRALLTLHAVIFAGALLLAGGTLAFEAGWIGPLAWTILVGTGLYLGYVPFSAMLFDRLIATFGRPANAGFLIYVADASGYGGSVGLLVYRSVAGRNLDWLRFFTDCIYGVAALVALLTLLSALYFAARALPGPAPVSRYPPGV